MRKLPIDLADVAAMMEMNGDLSENESFLDKETGETKLVPAELSRLEDLDDEELADLPEWEKELIPIARAVVEHPERYEPIPSIPAHDDYRLMERFAHTVADERLREKLAIALDGQGAFRRFRNVLGDYPEELKRWYAFKDEAHYQHVRDWLGEIGIDPIEKTV